MMNKEELSAAITDNGQREEYHQQQKEWDMFDHHKERRLELEKEYRNRFWPDHYFLGVK